MIVTKLFASGASPEATAAWFWTVAGGAGSYPRDLEEAVLWVLPLAVVKMPRLRVHDVSVRLRGYGVRLSGGPDRRLRGCLVAYGGKGCVVLDGTDPANEQRFSLAHEVAHFLVEYLQPRHQALAALGEGLLSVLDGERSPSVEERVHGVLAAVPIGVHVHMMDRRAAEDGASTVEEAESGADRLALELLAPRRDVRRRLLGSGPHAGEAEEIEVAVRLLSQEFGLPVSVAASYARQIVLSSRPAQPFREWLGMARHQCRTSGCGAELEIER